MDKFAQSSEMQAGVFLPREISDTSICIAPLSFLLLKSFKRIHDKPMQDAKVWILEHLAS